MSTLQLKYFKINHIVNENKQSPVMDNWIMYTTVFFK